MKSVFEIENELESNRVQQPCCLNCNNMYVENGMYLCKKNEEPMENIKEEHCDNWK